jgi:hypothetical protein
MLISKNWLSPMLTFKKLDHFPHYFLNSIDLAYYGQPLTEKVKNNVWIPIKQPMLLPKLFTIETNAQ